MESPGLCQVKPVGLLMDQPIRYALFMFFLVKTIALFFAIMNPNRGFILYHEANITEVADRVV